MKLQWLSALAMAGLAVASPTLAGEASSVSDNKQNAWRITPAP